MRTSSDTPRIVIESAFLALGKVSPKVHEMTAGLIALNDLIASWGADNLLIYTTISENFSLTIAQSSYTIGSGGDFDTARPKRILDGVYIRDANNQDYEVIPMTRQYFNQIGLKSESGRPEKIYYEPAFPLGVITFDTAPALAETLYIDSWKPLTEFTTLTQSINLPAEYKRALKFNLALDLFPAFGVAGNNVVDIATQASESKRVVENFNASNKPEESKMDRSITYRLK